MDVQQLSLGSLTSSLLPRFPKDSEVYADDVEELCHSIDADGQPRLALHPDERKEQLSD